MGGPRRSGAHSRDAEIEWVTTHTGGHFRLRVASRAGEVLGKFRSAIETSAPSQPGTTVTLAELAGFLFGAFWRTGSR